MIFTELSKKILTDMKNLQFLVLPLHLHLSLSSKGKLSNPLIRGQWVLIRGQWVLIRTQCPLIRTQCDFFLTDFPNILM